MAHLWISTADGWQTVALTEPLLALGAGTPPVQPPAPDEPLDGRILLRRLAAESGPERWLVIAPPSSGLWVNGDHVPTLRLLNDRDELRLSGGRPMYFSTETLAVVVPFPAAPRPVQCPRCRQPIVAGSPVIQCPGCGTYHHESDGCRCFTYAPTCAVCPHPTTQSGYAWQPDPIEA